MKKLLLVFACATLFGLTVSAQNKPLDPPKDLDDYFPELWKTCEFKEDKFKVRLPGKPTETLDNTPSNYTIVRKNAIIYRGVINYSILAVGLSGDAEKAKMADELIQKLKVFATQVAPEKSQKIVREQKITFRGHPGIFIQAEYGSDVVQRSKILVIGHHMYFLIASSRRTATNVMGSENDYEKIAMAFLDSFELVMWIRLLEDSSLKKYKLRTAAERKKCAFLKFAERKSFAFPKESSKTPAAVPPSLMFQISRTTPAYYFTSVTHHRLAIFRTEKLKHVLCDAFEEVRDRHGILILAYVIMPDHVHLLVRTEKKMTEALRLLNGVSARRVIQYLSDNGFDKSLFKLRGETRERNHKHSVWQHHPDSLEIFGEKTFRQKVDYIHQNPVRASLVESAHEYRFSSARHWAGNVLADEPLMTDHLEIDWR